MKRLSGRTVFVTGAGGGIASETCVRFLEEGANVAAVDIDTSSVLPEILQAERDGRAIVLKADAGDSDDVQRALRTTAERFQKINVLCAFAGGSKVQDSRVTEAPEDEFWRVVRLDLFGTFLLGKYGFPYLVETGGGSVINMTSMVALQGVKERACYTSAKGGVAALTRSMAADYGEHAVRVNAIAPGVTLTPRIRSFMETNPEVRSMAEKVVLPLAEPIDVANMAVYLASDESRVVTGQILAVDSGITSLV